MRLGQWWIMLDTSGELASTVGPDMQALGAFMAAFQDPNCYLLFEEDRHGVWLCMWGSPLLAGVGVGVWVRQDMRHSRIMLAAVEAGYDAFLTAFPVLVGITPHKRLLRTHQRLGYHIVGRIPGIWDGQDAWVVTLTRPWFEAAKAKRRAQRAGVAEGVSIGG